MDFNDDRIDDAVLALLAVFSFDNGRSWKGYDWDAMNRLHARGLISDPVGKAKSVYLSEQGMAQGMALAARLFAHSSKPEDLN